MKKLMIVAATAFLAFAGNALTLTECPNCGSNPVENSECDVVVFKITGSGKAVSPKGDYKTVSKLKIKKGALALTGSYCATSGGCCYDSGYLFATVKVGKNTFKVAQEITPAVWSVFGKDLDKAKESSFKKSKKYKIDSALYIESASDAIFDGTEVEDMTFAASAFGKIQISIPKSKKATACSSCEIAEPVIKPKSYSGWFVGKYACVGAEGCFLCDCSETDVFGGTWKASYRESVTTVSGAMKIAGVSSLEDDEL